MSYFGIDISEKRVDELGREILRYALSAKASSKRVLEIACGSGKVSLPLAILGFRLSLYDKKDLVLYFQSLSSLLKLERKINFIQKDAREIAYKEIPENLQIVIIQRFLHHIKYSDSEQLLKKIHRKMELGGRIFISVSGIDSELGEYYSEKKKEIALRYSKLHSEGQKKFQMKNPVCLYSKRELTSLVSKSGFKKVKIWISAFGNIQGIFEKK